MPRERSGRKGRDAGESAGATLPRVPRVDPDRRVVAVTGACGFIGSEVVKRLEEDRRYAKILAIDIRKPPLPLDKTQFYKVDLTLPAADSDLSAIFAREEVDTVLHAAFLASPTHAVAWAHELEDIGTMHVLNACAEARTVRKLVVSSTTMVYGADAANPNFIREEAELAGRGSPYIADKVSAERQVARFARENPTTLVTVLRVAPTLGPTVHNYVTKFFGRPAVPTLMGYDPLLQLVHEDDVIAAFKLALDDDHAGAYNIVGDGVLPYSTVLAMMGKLAVPVPHFVASSVVRALWAMQVTSAPPAFLSFLRFLCVADGDKARRVMGYKPRHDIRATVLDFLGVMDDEINKGRPAKPAGVAGGEKL
jgi:UDP-glucose 4-epimerase